METQKHPITAKTSFSRGDSDSLTLEETTETSRLPLIDCESGLVSPNNRLSEELITVCEHFLESVDDDTTISQKECTPA